MDADGARPPAHPAQIHATLAKYALASPEVSDVVGTQGRAWLRGHLDALPPRPAYVPEQQLDQVQALDRDVRAFEQGMRTVFRPTPEIERLMTLPGVGFTLAVVIALEMGDVTRLASSETFAAYAGTTPRVCASGGKTRCGRLRPDVNHYLKWVFVEAAA